LWNGANHQQDFVRRDNMRFLAERDAEAEQQPVWEDQNQPILVDNDPIVLDDDDHLPTYDETVQQATEAGSSSFEADAKDITNSDIMDTSMDH
jgi:hypothetical protein